jgi:methyl-accepting chemotaxis protein
VKQTSLLVHNGSIVKGYGGDGKELPAVQLASIPLSALLQDPSGLVVWNNQNYFFMHLQPFDSVDLHFFLLIPEAAEFAFLKDLVNGSKKVVDAILFDIHALGLVALIIVIALLHHISRRMTKPIIQLAKATQDVAEGRLDQIQLALPPKKHQDEIAVLCHSFEEMVKGLQEKEKVKGVLNKVVYAPCNGY